MYYSIWFNIALSLTQALAMVEDEKKRYRPTKNYLEHLPPVNITTFEVSFITFVFKLQVCVIVKIVSRVDLSSQRHA